jgi:hypothetical protein
MNLQGRPPSPELSATDPVQVVAGVEATEAGHEVHHQKGLHPSLGIWRSLLIIANTRPENFISCPFKGIVSRDRGQVHWILSDRSEEFMVIGAYFYVFQSKFP